MFLAHTRQHRTPHTTLTYILRRRGSLRTSTSGAIKRPNLCIPSTHTASRGNRHERRRPHKTRVRMGSRTCNATHLPRTPRTHAHHTHRLAHHTHPTPKTHTLRPHSLPHTHTRTRVRIHAPKKQVITHEQHDDEARTSEPNAPPHPPRTSHQSGSLPGRPPTSNQPMYAHVTARCTPGPPPMRRRGLREVGPIRCPALCGPLPPSSAAEASRGLSLFRRRTSRVLVRSAPARARAPHGNQSRPGTRQWQRRSSTHATKISTASATVPAAPTPTYALAATHKNASKPALCVAPATQPRARAPTRPY